MNDRDIIDARRDLDAAKAALRGWGISTDEQIRADIQAHIRSFKSSAVQTAKQTSIWSTLGALGMGLLAGRTAKRGKVPKIVSLATLITIGKTVLPIIRTVMAMRR